MGLLLLAACQPLRTPSTLAPATAIPAPLSGQSYTIDGVRSRVSVLVYRAGPMAQLGHNHVIAIHALQGTVQLGTPLTQSSFQLQFPVASMSVDEADLRAAAGADFALPVDDDARQGTRRNMLGEQGLQSKRYGMITLRTRSVSQDKAGLSADTEITVRDHIAVIRVPMQLNSTGNELRVTGEFKVTQSELGLTPYSIMMGALRVSDELTVRFDLRALLQQAMH